MRSITQEGLFLKKNYGKQHFRSVLTVFHGLLPIFGASFFKSSNFADLPISSYLTLLVLVLFFLSFPVIPPSAFPARVITASSSSCLFCPGSGGRRRGPGFGSLLEAEDDDTTRKRRSGRTWTESHKDRCNQNVLKLPYPAVKKIQCCNYNEKCLFCCEILNFLFLGFKTGKGFREIQNRHKNNVVITML